MTGFASPHERLFEGTSFLAGVFLLLLVFLPVAYFFGARTSGVTEDKLLVLGEIEDMRIAWSAKKPDQFQYLIEERCFCDSEASGPFRVVVRNSSQRILATGDTPVKELPEIASVEDLFNVLEQAVLHADDVSATYHDKYSFPVRIRIDWTSKTIDDEVTYLVSAFELIEAPRL